MIQQFNLLFSDVKRDFSLLKHIQYNIHKRLNKLSYVKLRTINIYLKECETSDDTIFLWRDNKTVEVTAFLPHEVLDQPAQENSVKGIYGAVFEVLNAIWTNKSWNSSDLIDMESLIQEQNYSSVAKFGKQVISPNRKQKANFVVEVFPEYAVYYVEFSSAGTKEVQRVEFLKGHILVDFFFIFFPNAYWRDTEYFILTDLNREIFYLFHPSTKGFTIEYSPKINSLEQCKAYVKAFQFDTPLSETKRILGF